MSNFTRFPHYRRLFSVSLFALLLCTALSASAQVGIGTTTPNANSILDLTSSDKGFLPPRLDRSAITTGAGEAGMIVYDNVSLGLYFWDGSAWQPINTGATGDDWGAQVAQTTGALQGTGVVGNELNLIDGTAADEILKWNGTSWALATDENTTYFAGSDISISASVISNTAPDQTVVMNNGPGINVTGTYPNFTVTNTAPDQTVALTSSTGLVPGGTYPNLTVDLPTATNTDDVLKWNGTTWVTGAPSGLNFFVESDAGATDPGAVWAPDASIGTNAGIVLQPRGTGYIAADAPDNAIAGGDERGEYAVDLQMERTNASEVASGNYATISGGERNNASGIHSNVGGGFRNTASGSRSTVGGGLDNTTSGSYSTVGGGAENTANGLFSTIPGGRNLNAPSYGEVALGYYNTDYTPNDTLFKNAADRLLVVGNGTFGTGNELDALRLMKSGNMSIGNLNPTARLHVDGDFRVENGPAINEITTTVDNASTALQLPTADAVWSAIGSAPGDGWGSDVVQTTARISGNGTTGNELDIAPNGANPLDVLQWNGLSWVPSAPNFLNFFTESDAGATDPGAVWAPDASIGTNAGIALQPLGTGYIAADAPDNAIAGGDARGDYAVDWQMERTNASEVASGNYATVGGGERNTASASRSTVGGGDRNTASNIYSTVGGGLDNTASGSRSIVGGGNGNTASEESSTVGGGQSNIASARFASIPGGLSLNAPSYGEVALGYFNTTGPSNSTISKDTLDRLLVVGNGVSGTPEDALRLMKSGNMAIGDLNPTARLHVDGDFRVQTGPAINEITTTVDNSSTALQLPTADAVWSAIGSAPGDGWGTDVAQTTGALTGDGTAGNPLELIAGTNTDDVLKWDGSAWVSDTDANTEYTAGTGLLLFGTAFSADNTNPIWNASQLQAINVSSAVPTTNQVLTYNGTQWEPQTPASSPWTENAGNVYRLTGNVGIGVAPTSTLFQVEDDITGGLMNFENRNTTGASFQAGRTGYYLDVATSGTEAVFGGQVNVRSDAAGNKYGMDIQVGGSAGLKRGINMLVTGAGGGISFGNYITNNATATSNYGTRASVSGASTNNYALWASATNATNNYALYVQDGRGYFGGNVGIGYANPAAELQINGALQLGPTNPVDQVVTNISGTSTNSQLPTAASVWNAVSANASPWDQTNTPDIGYAAGNVGIGTIAPSYALEVIIDDATLAGSHTENLTGTIPFGGNFSSGRSGGLFRANSGGTETKYALQAIGSGTDGNVNGGRLSGVGDGATGQIATGVQASATRGETNRGVYAVASGTNGTNYGIYSAASSTGTAGELYGGFFETSGASTVDKYGIYVDNGSSSTTGTSYGAYLDNSGASSTTRYGVYATGETQNYFSGNVGIGTNAPTALLDVDGFALIGDGTTTGNQLQVKGNSGNTFFTGNAMVFSGANAVISRGNGDDLSFQESGSTQMTIKSGGNVGIGTTAPSALLDVAGDFRVQNGTAVSNIATSMPVIPTNDQLLTAAAIDGAISGGQLWSVSGSDVYRSTGRVGVGGTPTVNEKMRIYGGTERALYARSDLTTNASMQADNVNGTTFPSLTAARFGLVGRAGSDGTEVKIGVRGGAAGAAGNLNGGWFSTETGAAGQFGFAVYANATGLGDNYSVYAPNGRAYFNDNVGIGTTTPTSLLDVAGTTDTEPLVQLTQSGNSNALRIDRNVAGATTPMVEFVQNSLTSTERAMYVANSGTGDIFAASGFGGAEIVVIDNEAKLGVGTTNPLYTLDVEATTTSYAARIKQNFASGEGLLIDHDGDGRSLDIRRDGTGATGVDMVLFDDNNTNANASSATLKLERASTDGYLFEAEGDENDVLINADGNVGIGTNPVYGLDVDINSTGYAASIEQDNAAGEGLLVYHRGDGRSAYFRRDGTGSTSFDMITFADNNTSATASSATLKLERASTVGNVLDVEGDDQDVVINADGNVGIGTTTPNNLLDVAGTTNANPLVQLTQSGNSNALRIDRNVAGAIDPMVEFVQNSSTSTEPALYVANSGTGSIFEAGGFSAGEIVVIDDAANVGIGTAAPDADLHIRRPSANVIVEATSTANKAGLSLRLDPIQRYANIEFEASSAANAQLEFYIASNDPNLVLDNDKDVGINVLDPIADLHVVGSPTLGEIMVAPDESTSNLNSRLFLAEDDNATYGMYWQFDGADNDMQLWGKSFGTTYGPHITVARNTGNTEINANLNVTGTLSKGSGTFKIDHPQDPENKYLYHSFVESPDMMNVYNGNVTTDANGEATVELPGYFEELNKDFRYQLTVIGSFAQAIVKEEVAGNQFKIATDEPNVKVSWQVTGIRQDPFANENRVHDEVWKPEHKRGSYLHPELYNQPGTKNEKFAKPTETRTAESGEPILVEQPERPVSADRK